MTLIDDHVDPFDLGEERSILDDILVSGEQNVEIGIPHLLLFNLASIWSSSIADEVDTRCPFLEFMLPVRKSTTDH